MSKAYISEFELFMNQYLKDHPEVVEERMRNWRSFWEARVTPAPMKIDSRDIVPDEHYGFFD